LGLGGVECGEVVRVLGIGLALELNLLVEVELGRVHGLGELFGLPGKFLKFGQCVLGRICGSRAAQDGGHGRQSDDKPGHGFVDNAFRRECVVKFQDFASFDCRWLDSSHVSVHVLLVSDRLRNGIGFVQPQG
jgi:hypothetical protein